ncbi:MAG: glutamine-hydrolyzing GMP synthase [Armatimonadetes bacterium]|nr:glutamine-hydrolyzing GMP synthase [Armatimonadota bacterium]
MNIEIPLHSPEMVLVLDFGSQYNRLIVRKVRECGVYCELIPHDTPVKEIERLAPKGLILSGGPASVYDKNAPHLSKKLLESGIPVLGICYGMQLLAHLLGGSVAPGHKREYGRCRLMVHEGDSLFRGLPDSVICWMSHGDIVHSPPSGFSTLAGTADVPVAAMGDSSRRIFGVQFHPEVTHTQYGKEILKNFLSTVCGCSMTWDAGRSHWKIVEELSKALARGKAICALSGGVDSTVAAGLVSLAMGDRLTCVFVDNGLLRLGEVEMVKDTFSRLFSSRFVAVDGSARFLKALSRVVDPEEKRKRIGREFIRVFEEEAGRLGRTDFLVQGTLYPDVIESRGTRTAAKIKTHHNVGGLPRKMKLTLVEPLRYLFKDEVRIMAKSLGLPDRLIQRQPFPGPGLAVRVLGEVTPERLDTLRQADLIVREEIEKIPYEDRPWQFFAVLLPVKSVGVMGDGRTYADIIGVRAVNSEDGMTCDWSRLSHSTLETISSRIVNEVPGVNRVVYDITSKPPATIEWE